MIKFTILLVILGITISIQISNELKQQPCFCANEGLCVKDTGRKSLHCNCSKGFIGRACEQSATQLIEILPNQNVTDIFKYYYYSFTNRSAYLMILNFSSSMNKTTTFLIQKKIQFNSNESLQDQQSYQGIQYTTSSYLRYRKSIQNVLVLSQLFTESASNLQLILRIRILEKGLEQTLNKTATINITAQITDLMIYNQKEIYYFLIFTSISTCILFIFTYIICVLIIKIRPRRYSRAVLAQPFYNIAHFDQQFPAILFENLSRQINEDEQVHECIICLLSLNQSLVRVVRCGHCFHKECIDKWGVRSLTCPVCRQSLIALPKNQQMQHSQIRVQFA